jgi:uncharacterized repeat protein (TIGR01451 family)
MSKTGYGPLPVTGYPFGPDAAVKVALPPSNDVSRNGNFEAGLLPEDWTTAGVAPPAATNSVRHTGNQSVQFGTVQRYGEPDVLAVGPSYTDFHTAVGDDNRVHAITSINNSWLYIQADPNGVWGPTQELPRSTNCQLQYEDQQDMKVRANGMVQLVWVAENTLSTPYDEWLCYYERTTAGAWRPLGSYHFNEFPSQGTDFRQVNFKIAPDGVIHVTWMHRTDDYKWRLFYAWRETNGVWSNIETIAESLGDEWFKTWLYVPDLAIEPNGTVHFVWMQRETTGSGSTNLFYRFRAPGGQWSPTEQITTYDPQFNPPSFIIKLNIDGNGVLHLVYMEESSSFNYPLNYMRRTTGSWSPITSLGISSSDESVDIILDSEDALHIVWNEADVTHYVRTSSLSSTFTNFTFAEMPVGESFLRLDAMGRLHFLFTDQGHNHLYLLLDEHGNQLDQQESPDLFYADFEVDRNAAPHFFGIVWSETPTIVHVGPARVSQNRDLTLSQTVTIPTGMEAPVLSYFFLYDGLAVIDDRNSFDVLLDDGQMSVLAQQSETNKLWQHHWVDLAPWAGETITLTFRLSQEKYAPNTWLFVDDVTLGSAHPDLWLSVKGSSGLPGEQIEQTLTYGNRGGAVAAGTRLTYTLPAELSFVSASVPPVSTSPLVWELEGLPAKSQPYTLSVVVQISPTAVPFSTLTSTAVIQPTNNELETLNNTVQGWTFVGNRIYLPAVQR